MSGNNVMPPGNGKTQPIGATPGISTKILEPRPLTGITRRFADLRVRPKLMVLHNFFFLVLTCAVYFTIINFIAARIDQASAREVTLILNSFAYLTEDNGQQELRPYDLRTGDAGELGLSDDARLWMHRYPGRTWQRTKSSAHIFKLVPNSGRFYRLTLPLAFYDQMLANVKLGVLAVLGIIYLLAVLVLEFFVLPRYVYQPIRLLLEADAATRDGHRAAELIPDPFIPADEIGQIMRSHNETVTKLRQHEDELEAAKRHLEAQDRLVSLGLLSASVAHEMNTPLAVLHGSIEKLMETIPDPPTQLRLARMIRVTERLRRISEGLLDFARQRRQETSPVELRPLIDEAWHLIGIDDKAGDVMFTNDAQPGHRVTANPDRLLQVFVNLLRNALIAVPPGAGHIRASTRSCAIDGRPAVSITVEDNGPGIPHEILPEIFEAFVTTRLDARGTGLGLAVAEGIVHQHGGSISAANCPLGGARLEVILPATEEQHPA